MVEGQEPFIDAAARHPSPARSGCVFDDKRLIRAEEVKNRSVNGTGPVLRPNRARQAMLLKE
jgi:hypothetical protein